MRHRKLSVGLTLLASLAHAAPEETAVTGPTVLRLGENNEATLAFVDPRYAQLAWSTNIGSLRAAPDGNGLRYHVASSTYPRVALVGAYDPLTRTPLLHVIRLHALPTIEVDSEPNATVTVELAGQRFGPLPTDADGTARIPVEVPPGVPAATTLVTDAHGNVTINELPLSPPPFSRVLAICAPEETAVYVSEVDDQGSPSTSPSFSLSAGKYRSSVPSEVRAGVYRVALEANNRSGEAERVEVRVTATGFSSSCSFETRSERRVDSFTVSGHVLPVAPERDWFTGARLGWLTNGDRISGPWFGVRLHRSVQGDRAGLRLGAELGFIPSSDTLLTTDDETLDLSVRTWPLLASAEYVVDWRIVRPKATADLGVALTQARAVGTTVYTDETFVSPWLGLSVGGEWWYRQHQLDALLGYAWANHNSGAIVGNVAGMRGVVGYQYTW